MLTILWWILGVLGLLLLVLLLWLGYRVLTYRRLQPLVFEFLSLPNAATALAYIEQHPRLLSAEAERFIRILLDRAWDRGDEDVLVFGLLHWVLLEQYRKQGVETVRQTIADQAQDWLATMTSPAGDRALKIMGHLVAEGKASIPDEELDEELVDALSLLMGLLHPVAADEETATGMDANLERLRQVVRQKAEGALQPSSDILATPSPSSQPGKRKRRRRRKRK